MMIERGWFWMTAVAAALVLGVSCAGTGAGDGAVFTPVEGTTASDVPNTAVPGYYSGVVPWEIQDEPVVQVTVQPQPELAPGDGKMTRSLSGVAFVTPQEGDGARGTSALSDSGSYYYAENAGPSAVQGTTLDAGAGPAFACYELAAAAGAPHTVGLAWYSLPLDMDNYYVGIGDRQQRAWHWYQGPDDGVLTFDADSWAGGGGLGTSVLVCVALENGQVAELWQLHWGVPEVRGTGLLWEEPVVDPAEQRDVAKTASSLPAAVDLRPCAPAVHNQGSMGSCTAFGVNDAALNIMLNQLYGGQGWNPSLDENLTSPMWSYVKSGIPPIGNWTPLCGATVGRYMSQAFNVVEQIGTATEATVPYYATENCSTVFPEEADVEAALLRIDDWHSIYHGGGSLADYIKDQLATHCKPVVIAMYGLESTFLNYSGGVYHYGGTQGAQGGHAMCIVGYDNALQAFDVRNSWGTWWGVGGHWWCGYDAADDLAALGRFAAYYMDVSYNPDAAAYFLDVAPEYDEVEPNNTLAQAKPLPGFDFASFSGTLGQAGDAADCLSFTYEAGWSTEFTLGFNQGVANLDLELYLTDGTLLATSSGAGGQESITGIWSSSGTAILRAVCVSGSGEYLLNGVQREPPAPPAELTASDGTNPEAIDVSWVAVPFVETYIIERSGSAEGPYTQIGSTFAQEFADDQVSANTQYWYRVLSQNGEGVGLPSEPDSGYRGTLAPQAIQASDAQYADRVVVSWASVPGAAAYQLKRSQFAEGPYTLVGQFAESPGEDYNAEPGLSYFYAVCAVLDGGEGPRSEPDVGSIPGPPEFSDGQVADGGSGDAVQPADPQSPVGGVDVDEGQQDATVPAG